LETNGKLIAEGDLEFASQKMKVLIEKLNEILMGKPDVVHKVAIALISQGHLLLEGLPGLGKTELVKGLSQLLEMSFRRIQFTPDLMPGDITGTMILQDGEDGRRKMVFQKGPVFTHLLLADEINRASPKTQASLLEAMAERQVSVLGQQYVLDEPFLVLATQNPIDMEGTYPLPEAQLDRFLFKLYFNEVQESVLEKIIEQRTSSNVQKILPVLNREDCIKICHLVKQVYLPKEVGKYIARIVASTVPSDPQACAMVKSYVRFGCSPRAAINISLASKANALINKRPYVGFEDVKAVAQDVLHHRIHLSYQAGLDRITGITVAKEVLKLTKEVPNEVLNRV
jgi:MoxR-like ATPase